MKNEIDKTVERIGQLPREPNKCPDCGFEPLDYSDDDVITCWRCDAQDYKRMYDKEFAARMNLKADLATAKQGLETADRVVPTNWCDPLLTGDKSVFKQTEKWDGRDIEALLRGVQDRIREHAKQILEDGDRHVCKCCEKPCDCSSHLPCDGCVECQNDPTLQMKF